MDTSAVASAIGTDPRTLRRFLRSSQSAFQAVGCGARYDFTEEDILPIREGFIRWNAQRTPSVINSRPKSSARIEILDSTKARRDRDEQVWAEEAAAGTLPINLPNIHHPRVRRYVQEVARRQENRLMEMVMAAGLHITQA